jgi:hypothetical protein
MSYADSITSLANATLTVTRRQEAAPINGRAQPPTMSTLSILASAQPTSGRDLLRLGDGRITGDRWTVYTKTRIYIGSTEAGIEGGYLPDLITIGDKQHEVEHLEHWEAFGAQHYKAICRAVVS